MKALVPVKSSKRNPTKAIKENPAITKEYLLLIDGHYCWGRFSFVTHKWFIIEKFDTAFGQNTDGEIIWFEEKTIKIEKTKLKSVNNYNK